MTDREKMIDLIINAKKTDPETGSFTEYLADFLLGYGVKLPTPTPQPGKPLTLDQLQEMDGKPVWIVEYPDWGTGNCQKTQMIISLTETLIFTE